MASLTFRFYEIQFRPGLYAPDPARGAPPDTSRMGRGIPPPATVLPTPSTPSPFRSRRLWHRDYLLDLAKHSAANDTHTVWVSLQAYGFVM